LALALLTCLFLPACDIHVKKSDGGDNKNVDINTPVGGIHVENEAKAQDTGLAVYPGSRISEKTGNDEKQATVDVSVMGYGVKVVAVEYKSDDPPSKIIAFYRDQLKKYGNVLECHSQGSDIKADPKSRRKELSCDADSGKSIELKVGTEGNQHVVNVDADGTGTKFALVHVNMRAGDTI